MWKLSIETFQWEQIPTAPADETRQGASSLIKRWEEMPFFPTTIKLSVTCLHYKAEATVWIKMGQCPLTHKHKHTPCGWVVHDRRPRRHVLSAERSQPLFRKTAMLRPPHSQTHRLHGWQLVRLTDWHTGWLNQLLTGWRKKISNLPTEWLTGGKSNWHAALWECGVQTLIIVIID